MVLSFFLLQNLVVLHISEPCGPLPFPSEPRGPLPLWLPCLGLNTSTHLPLQPHPQLLLQLVTPASIPVFFQLYWAAIVSLGRRGPTRGAKHLQAFMQVLYPQGFPPSYIRG